MDRSTEAIATEICVFTRYELLLSKKIDEFMVYIILFNSRLVSLLKSYILGKIKGWCHGKQLKGISY